MFRTMQLAHKKRIVWPVLMVFIGICIVGLIAGWGSFYFGLVFLESLSITFLVLTVGSAVIVYFCSYAAYLLIKDKLWMSSRKKGDGGNQGSR